MASNAIDSGAKIYLGMSVKDLVFRENRIEGVICQWVTVEIVGLHVDPVVFKSKVVIDCTGHGAEVLIIASKKIPELRLELQREKLGLSR
jgi:thiamine thiazole synthase